MQSKLGAGVKRIIFKPLVSRAAPSNTYGFFIFNSLSVTLNRHILWEIFN